VNLIGISKSSSNWHSPPLLDTLSATMARQSMPVRVLVVDDDAMVREFLAILLEAEGYAVQSAASGDAALAGLAAPAPAPQVILADVQMPGTSGSQLAAELRRLCGPGARLIAMSGSSPEPAALALYDAFLLKPFTAQQFAAIVAAAKPASPQNLRGQPARPVTRPRPTPPTSPQRSLAGSPQPATLASVFASAPEAASNIAMDTRLQNTRSRTATKVVLGRSRRRASTNSPVLNEAIYTQLSAAMPAPQLREMYAMCLSDARERIRTMRSLARSGDRLRFSREAHSIKGGSGMLGATEIYALAAGLEAETRDPAPAGPFSNVNSLDELSAACDRLERILGSRA
jgi:CheY-like chemotaxis protein/HPt (histidine-containing phosphotransfer) domain-containing protein